MDEVILIFVSLGLWHLKSHSCLKGCLGETENGLSVFGSQFPHNILIQVCFVNSKMEVNQNAKILLKKCALLRIETRPQKGTPNSATVPKTSITITIAVGKKQQESEK
ncbi:hypothetical protein ACJX0J_039899 [Zea mays]